MSWLRNYAPPGQIVASEDESGNRQMVPGYTPEQWEQMGFVRPDGNRGAYTPDGRFATVDHQGRLMILDPGQGGARPSYRQYNVGQDGQLTAGGYSYQTDARPWYMKPAVGAALAVGLPIGLGALGAGAFGGAVGGGATGAGTAGTAGASATGAVASPVAAGSATLTNLPALGAGGASGLGGLLSSAAGTAGNWIKDNPWTAAGLAGLLGAGLSQQMNRPKPQPQYTPRNLGGNFTPQVQAQYQPLPDRSGLTLNTQPGAQGSGLWRFMR